MRTTDKITTKKNVDRFDDDVRRDGFYTYRGPQLSARLATARISRAIADSYDFRGKTVLDLGCGDGIYSIEMIMRGATCVFGIDASPAAISTAYQRAISAGVESKMRFEVGNIYDLISNVGSSRFDCVMLWGVLHHLSAPSQALIGLSDIADSLIILEPNGMNPVLKALEALSSYHIAHEERSFTPRQLKRWMESAGFHLRSSKLVNLVPMFSADWLARPLRLIEPVVERLPALRDIACGQVVLVGDR